MERFKEEIKVEKQKKLAVDKEAPFYKTQAKLNSFTNEVNQLRQTQHKQKNFVEHVKRIAKRSKREYEAQLDLIEPMRITLRYNRKKSKDVSQFDSSANFNKTVTSFGH